MEFVPASDQALLVTLGDSISLDTHRRVIQLLHALDATPPYGLLNLHPAYTSILLRFDSLLTSHSQLEAQVRFIAGSLSSVTTGTARLIEIPVRYDGPDLEASAAMLGLAPAHVVELHVSTLYTVFFLGFVPGFAYMGTLPDALILPRLDVPRKSVPAGSVAIANHHTAIYPIPTPGGWRLLGHTDVELFNPHSETLSLLTAGDQVRFLPV